MRYINLHFTYFTYLLTNKTHTIRHIHLYYNKLTCTLAWLAVSSSSLCCNDRRQSSFWSCSCLHADN